MQKNTIGITKLSKEVAHRTGIGRPKTDKVVRALFSVIKDVMYSQGSVTIPGFGVFNTKLLPPTIHTLPNGNKTFLGTRMQAKFHYTQVFRNRVSRIKIKSPTADATLFEGGE